MSKREHGKVSFAHLQDASGLIQIYARINNLGEERYGQFKELDLGDIIGVTGKVFKTHRGETTVELSSYLLSKAAPLAGEMAWSKRRLRYRQRCGPDQSKVRRCLLLIMIISSFAII